MIISNFKVESSSGQNFLEATVTTTGRQGRKNRRNKENQYLREFRAIVDLSKVQTRKFKVYFRNIFSSIFFAFH